MRKSALFGLGLVVMVLVALGLVVLSSACGENGMRIHGDAYYFMKRQFIYLVAGVVAAVCVAGIDYHKWRDYPILTWLLYAGVLVMLVLVLPPFGRRINGSFRWLSLGGMLNVQPSEFAKLVIVYLLAVWLDRSSWRVELFVRGALLPAVFIGIPAFLILKEPDFGSFMVLSLLGILVMFLAGVRILHLLPFAAIGAGAFVYKLVTNANRMARIAAFFGIKLDIGAEVLDTATRNAEYQAQQALIAIKNGGIWGVGLGRSMQKHLYLPEAHTDFIFAIGAEELGLPFSLAVLGLFIAFFALCVYIASHAADRFGRLLVAGMSFLIFFQAMFNIGVVCKALPTKGMALPFFSYGGTNLVCAFIAVGTILSVGIHSYRDRRRRFPSSVLMR